MRLNSPLSALPIHGRLVEHFRETILEHIRFKYSNGQSQNKSSFEYNADR